MVGVFKPSQYYSYLGLKIIMLLMKILILITQVAEMSHISLRFLHSCYVYVQVHDKLLRFWFP